MTYIPPTLEASSSVGIEALRGRHDGQTAWIVGKGPSLARLRWSDIGPGFVITINDAISVVQRFGLAQQIYALQKEGCEARDENGARPCGSCAAYGWKRHPLVDPYPGVTTLFSRHLASWCLHGRSNRYVYDAVEDFGTGTHTMSVLDAIPLALHLGADEIVMVCFDNMTPGGSWDSWGADGRDEVQLAAMRTNLEWAVPRMIDALREVPHRWLTP